MDLSGRSTRGKDRKRSNGNEQHYLSLSLGKLLLLVQQKNVMPSNFECLVQLDEYTSSKNVLKIKATFIQS